MVRLSPPAPAAQTKFGDFLRGEIDAVILEVNEEFGLDLGGRRDRCAGDRG